MLDSFSCSQVALCICIIQPLLLIHSRMWAKLLFLEMICWEMGLPIILATISLKIGMNSLSTNISENQMIYTKKLLSRKIIFNIILEFVVVHPKYAQPKRITLKMPQWYYHQGKIASLLKLLVNSWIMVLHREYPTIPFSSLVYLL